MIAPTTAEDARFIADNLRDEEICVRLHGRERAANTALECGLDSRLSWIVYDSEAKPVAMFGADGERGEAFGSAWLFCTPDVKRAPRALIEGCAAGIAISRDYWPELRIESEPRSERQARFLEFLGFKPRTVELRGDEVWTELAI